MNRLSKLFQLLLECAGGILFELACLFAHQKMADQDREMREEQLRQQAELDHLYVARINDLKESKDGHIETLKTLLHNSETERKRLQDRLLQRNGSMPVFETPQEPKGDAIPAQSRDRERRVADRTKQAIEQQKKALDEDVGKYLLEVKGGTQSE